MSSSSDGGLAPVFPLGTEVRPLETPELRTGTWTRLGDDAVLGDPVTERVLSVLAESTRTAARSQGYAVGWAEGMRAARLAADEEAAAVAEAHRVAEERREAEHRAACSALVAAAERLSLAVAEICADVEDRAAGLAVDLTETILGITGPDAGAVARALRIAPEGPITRVRVHPADTTGLDADTAAALEHRGAVLVADPSVERGDALVEYDDSVVDLRVGSALERVREVLR